MVLLTTNWGTPEWISREAFRGYNVDYLGWTAWAADSQESAHPGTPHGVAGRVLRLGVTPDRGPEEVLFRRGVQDIRDQDLRR